MRGAVVLAAAASLMAGCDRDTAPAQPVAPEPETVAPATLTRAEIVAALALAASARSAGVEPGEASTIAGRTFSIRLPFGCFGPAEADNARAMELGGDGLANWRWSEDRSTQILSLTPADWTRSERLIDAGQTPPWERADGYWIARPWLEGDNCPADTPAVVAPPLATDGEAGDDADTPSEAAALPPAPFTAGLAAIRSDSGSRLGRRDGDPYSFTLRGPEGVPPTAPSDGYRLVLQGRIGSFPDGHAVRCSSDSPNRRPVCIAAVVLDSVAFETADGRRLSEWRPER